MELKHDEELDPSEVKPLLEALDAEFFRPIEPAWEHPRVCDVAEALCKDPHHVAQVLSQLREREREARLVEVLTELEEPLHRVERPGLIQSDSGSWRNPAMRFGVIKTILDKLPREGLTINIVKPKQKETTADRVAYWFGLAIVVVVPLVAIALAVYSVNANR